MSRDHDNDHNNDHHPDPDLDRHLDSHSGIDPDATPIGQAAIPHTSDPTPAYGTLPGEASATGSGSSSTAAPATAPTAGPASESKSTSAAPPATPSDKSSADKSSSKSSAWGRVKTWVIVSLLVVIAAMFLALFLPLRWANFVTSIVDNHRVVGLLAGVVIGFVFTFVPLWLLSIAIRQRRRTGVSVVLFFFAFIFALPNLVTLWIVLGQGTGASEARNKFVESAPGFRGASLAGAGVALLGVLYLSYLVTSRNKARAKLKAVTSTSGTK